MWNKVAQLALDQSNFFIAQRCFAALGDFARARAVFEIMELAEKAAKEIGGDGTQSYKVRANVAQLRRKFKEAEKTYLEQNAVEEAIEMYQTLHKWDEALELAKAVVIKLTIILQCIFQSNNGANKQNLLRSRFHSSSKLASQTWVFQARTKLRIGNLKQLIF
ncbi:unnamed protein product [Strongylus vulgaris]|uniref:IFT80/172/WDR35 TPR domain-containing protein n=1 Tax=Strongylus vulgaris TaxID=40348 RepID=A0A3P7J087_STRVU|nr:unnamed protein product [Strongylus vulgaris]